ALPKNLFTHDAPGDWTVETRIDLDAAPSQNYQQATLGAIQDADNYVKIGYQKSGAGVIVQFGRAIGGTFAAPVAGTAFLGTQIYLRLTKQGDTYTAAYAGPDRVFTQAGEPTTLALTTPQVMLGAYNGNQTADPLTATYSHVLVTGTRMLESTDFTGGSPDLLGDGDWSILRPNPATWELDEDGLTITSEQGELYQGSSNGKGNNYVLHDAVGDWTATVHATLDHAPEAATNQQAALAVYQDDDNYAKIAYQFASAAPRF
ncbi:MAG: hypothetical protein LBK59_10695, partial [Bifidobacteriaceae bacterium]|nr:hypothetical protein [Bifidobacteriaceae bacterium]